MLDNGCHICWDWNNLRVLNCGHCYCLECLKLFKHDDGKIECPMDRREHEIIQLEDLPTPKNFSGEKLEISIEEKSGIGTINELVDDLVKRRIATIELLRVVAKSLASTEYQSAIAKTGGSTVSIVGSILGIVGLSLSVTGVGAAVGVPLLAAGSVIGVAGGVVKEGTACRQAVIKKKCLVKVQQHLDMDYFRSEQCRIISIRKSKDCDFGKKWDFDDFDLGDFGSLEDIANVASIAATPLAVAGVVLSELVRPFNIWQIVAGGRRLLAKDPSKQVRKLLDILNVLKKQLMKFWIDSDSLHLLPLKDDRWCCIAVTNSKKKDFEKRCTSEMTLKEAKEFGHVLEEGADFSRLPEDKLSQFIDILNHFEGLSIQNWIDNNCLHLVPLKGDKWCVIALDYSKKKEFMESYSPNMALNDVKKFGLVLEKGKDFTNLPSDKLSQIIEKSSKKGASMNNWIDNNCLHLVPLKGDKWCGIALDASKKKEFKKSDASEMTLDDVEKFGHVLENGEDFINLPKDRLSQVIERWSRMEKLHISYLEHYNELYSKQI